MKLSNEHVHNFSGATPLDAGHSHQFIGITGPAVSGGPHVHSVYTTTAVVQGHDHAMIAATGPAIQTQNGHVHKFAGLTTLAQTPERHHHTFDVNTGGDLLIGGPGGKWTQGPPPAY